MVLLLNRKVTAFFDSPSGKGSCVVLPLLGGGGSSSVISGNVAPLGGGRRSYLEALGRGEDPWRPSISSCKMSGAPFCSLDEL